MDLDFSGLFSNIGGSSSQALDKFSSALTANDIWKIAAQPILGAQFNRSTWSPWTSAATSAAQAFLGSALNEIGNVSEARQMQKVTDILPDLYRNPLSVDVPEGVDSKAFNILKTAAIADQATKNQKLLENVATDLFQKRPDLAMQLFQKPSGMTDMPEGAIPATTDEANPLSTGKDSTSQKLAKYFREFQAQGMPAVQAASAAKQQVQAEISANTKTFDEARSAREYGQKLVDLANTANAGITQAGKTGSFESAREFYDYMAANVFGDPDAEARRTGRQVLSSIAPEIVKTNRSPGAVSDFETKLYLGAGPNVNHTPETNALLAGKLEDLGKLNLDYADFLDAYRDANSGSTVGAAKKWAEYRNAFPIFKKSGNSIELNTNRPGWQEFFSGNIDVKTFVASAKQRGLSMEEAKREWEAMQ